MVQIHLERTIDAAPERVFAWLADPTSLTAAPLLFKAGWAKDSSAPGAGAVREGFGAGLRFREQLTAYDPPHGYSYRIIESFPPLAHEGGTLTFTPAGGGTRVDWISTYTHPGGAGRALERVSAPLLRWTFGAVLAGCARALEA